MSPRFGSYHIGIGKGLHPILVSRSRRVDMGSNTIWTPLRTKTFLLRNHRSRPPRSSMGNMVPPPVLEEEERGFGGPSTVVTMSVSDVRYMPFSLKHCRTCALPDHPGWHAAVASLPHPRRSSSELLGKRPGTLLRTYSIVVPGTLMIGSSLQEVPKYCCLLQNYIPLRPSRLPPCEERTICQSNQKKTPLFMGLASERREFVDETESQALMVQNSMLRAI